MAVRSRFTPRVPQAPAGRKLSSLIVNDMRGINSTDPYGILQNFASPYLRNARMYLSDTQRQVAISTRQGATYYSTPIGETEVDSETSTSGADETLISAVRWIAQKVTPSATSNLTKIEVNVKSNTGSAPVTVQIFDDDSGEPGNQLAITTIQNSDISTTAGYVSARFVDAPTLTISTDYWLVFSVQEADSDTYLILTTDNTANGLVSENAGNVWGALNYSINFRAFGSADGGCKGAFRYYPQNSQNITFLAHGDNIYTVDESDGSTTSVKASLDSNATRVRYAQFDDAVFAVNGFDTLQRSTGGNFADVAEAPSVYSNIVDHKNRLFGVSASDKSRIEFCELADYTDWESTGFLYVPEPKSSDPITGLVSFQDTLVIFTANNKWVLYGDDLGNFTLRQSVGKKGAVSQEAIVTDENFIYFVSDDGQMYKWNGSKDEQLSRPIEADLDDVANFNEARLTLWQDRIYYWFQPTGGTAFNANFVYETRYNEWFYDTGRQISGGIVLTQENDQVLFCSSRVGTLYRGGLNYSDLGKPIDFEYHTNYFDFGSPDNFKQVRRLYMQFRKTTWRGNIQVGADVDFRNDPTFENINTQSGGFLWGDNLIEWGDSDIFWGSNDQYFRHRMNVPGQGTHYQARVKKYGSETPLYFIGYSMFYRNRRPA
jgi:hypothetical protein